MGHHERAAGFQVGFDLLPVDAALNVVGDDHHDHVGLGGYFRHIGNAQAGRFGRGNAGTTGIQSHDNVLAVVLQVEGVRVTLAAVSDDADCLTF